MRRALLVALVAVALAGGVAACGKKGRLLPPPASVGAVLGPATPA
ncbi:MAG: sugar transporter [Alphaproteobacteria bacterium]